MWVSGSAATTGTTPSTCDNNDADLDGDRDYVPNAGCDDDANAENYDHNDTDVDTLMDL